MDIGIIVLVIIVLIRLLVPLVIFKKPLLGAALAILGDISDVMAFEAFGSGPLSDSHYHNFDKFFDTYYLFIEFMVASRWASTLARRTAKGLFIWRFLGFFIFEISTFFGNPIRPAFFLAPNIFENFFIAWLVILKFKPDFHLNLRKLIYIILIVGLPKIAQEYIMHFAYPDQTWNFLRDHLFWWIYN